MIQETNNESSALLNPILEDSNKTDKPPPFDYEQWSNVPDTLYIFCFKFESTKGIVTRVYSTFLLFIVAAEIVESVIISSFVGRLGEESVNAKSVVDNIFAYVSFLEALLMGGLTVRVAESRIKQQLEFVRGYIILGILASISYGVVAGGIILGMKDVIYQLLDLKNPSLSSSYFYTQVANLPFDFVTTACLGVMMGLFDLGIYTGIVCATTTFSILGAYLAIYVFDFGLVGVGIVTLTSDIFEFVLVMIYFVTPHFYEKYKLKIFTGSFPSIRLLLSFLEDNLFLIITDSLSTLSSLIIVPLAFRLGQDEAAAITVSGNILQISTSISQGFSYSITMVGTTLITRQIFSFFNLFFTRTLLMPLLFSTVCFLVMCISPTFVQQLFYGNNESNRQSVIDQLSTLWWLTASMNIINTVFIMFQACAFCFVVFKEVAFVSIFALCVGYIPLIVAGMLTHSIYLLQMGVAAFAMIRAVILVIYYCMRLRYGVVDV